MGYLRNHAIVVESIIEREVEAAHQKAVELGCAVTEIVEPQINGSQSFMVAPDGSKEGWEESDAGDARRNALVDWLQANSRVNWAEVQFGDDDDRGGVTRGSDLCDLSGRAR